MTGIFNPNGIVLSDLSLIITWLVFSGLIVAWFLAYRKNYDTHHKIIWVLLILNLMTILYMVFQLLSAARSLLNNPEIIPIVHSSFGALVFVLAIYTALLMSYPNKIPKRIRITNTFLLMRTTAILWIVLILSGTFLYLNWYGI